ncbi:hypothetical protein LX73_0658 [Fodinibius salinus]|uniref:Methyltransferase domain-containing protein n=1 Tax=Fodinibius salinus TaxID=860790 RepID=A0A5D3YNJ5_9BACT|nr:hypothetical protein [Fodinibius salinus]TYP95357.1 hypothetical protein LX73_0658 [Fodinibius salinus]
MKRIHLFEFEDFAWFPDWLRRCIMRLIAVMHDLLGTSHKIAKLIANPLRDSYSSTILDLCSGSGGPMPEVLQILHDKYDMHNISLTLTDLYPDLKRADVLNSQDANNITYLTSPTNATQIDGEMSGFRTMIGSFHHMKPTEARKILASVQNNGLPIFIFEVSDNSTPIGLWWIVFPINFIMTFFITPMVRPMTWQQLIFTYIIPIVPICFGWDGAVSNARTYTLNDLDELLSDIESHNYKWEKGTIEGKTSQIYLLGLPN